MLTALSNQISSKYAPLQEALLIWSKAKVTDIELSAMVDSSRLIAVLGNLLLFALVFGMSATVEISSVRTQIRNYRAILTGMLCQFHVLPLLGFLVVRGMQLNHSVGLTLLVVTSSPGGSYSNWFCSLFNADLALSVSMTAISTILSIVMLPANLIIYTHFAFPKNHDEEIVGKLDWTALFVALAIVISGIALGLYSTARVQDRRFNKIANHVGNLAGFILIVFSATVTNTGSSDSRIWARHWTFYVGVALPCLGGLLVSTLLASALQLKYPERVSTAIECSYQNVGIATSLALTMFNGNDLNEAMGVPFFYGVVEALAVSMYCIGAWKVGWTKAPSDASFWNIISTSYEVVQSETKTQSHTTEHTEEGSEDITLPTSEMTERNMITSYANLEMEPPPIGKNETEIPPKGGKWV